MELCFGTLHVHSKLLAKKKHRAHFSAVVKFSGDLFLVRKGFLKGGYPHKATLIVLTIEP